jgi:hypothetical protein
MTSKTGREQAAPRKVTLAVSEKRSRSVEERLMMDGKASKAVRSKIHSPYTHGVNSAVWVQERAGHESQGTSPGLEHPVNLSWVSASDVRNCREKTTPCVEKKDLLEAQTAGLPLLGSECSSLAGMGGGLYRRGHTMRERGCSSQGTARLLASVYL